MSTDPYVLVIKMLKELFPSIRIFLTGGGKVLEQRDFKTKLGGVSKSMLTLNEAIIDVKKG